MRFNKAELSALASNGSIKFDKEGLLIITERQEGFFRKAEVNHPRWCKLRGNLLFYLRNCEPSAQAAGVLVLENCRVIIPNEERDFDGFAFILEFNNSLPQRISARTVKDRTDWVKIIQLASYSYLNRQIKYLEHQIAEAMGNRIERGLPCRTDNDGSLLDLVDGSFNVNTKGNVKKDFSEVPLCECALSCNDLPICENGRLPNVRVVCSVFKSRDFIWRDYACTEIVENCSNPQFLCTICFHQSEGFSSDTPLRFTAYDVKEKFSITAVPIGYAELTLGVLEYANHFRIPLSSARGTCFISIVSWSLSSNNMHNRILSPSRSSTQIFEKRNIKRHHRSLSLPPKLGLKLFMPFHSCLHKAFANPLVHTYRLHSTLGSDIAVQESMLESKLCHIIPQQLLAIWIVREKELLQEISGMGELGGKWRQRQMDLLDKHLKLLNKFSQAKQNLEQLSKEGGSYFKKSVLKSDESLEFIPVNLHLQRMWAQSDGLNKSVVLDVITVGAFTKHVDKYRKSGGLIRLLQHAKDSPTELESSTHCKIQAANESVQTIKQLRKDIVNLMSELLDLAKQKSSKGMMSLSNKLVAKTKTLLNIWEPNLVDEAFAFIEKHRILEEPDNILMPVSPFRMITQQLNDLALNSPELEDFSTTTVHPPDLWPPESSGNCKLVRSNSLIDIKHLSFLTLNAEAIYNIHSTAPPHNEPLKQNAKNELPSKGKTSQQEESKFHSLPVSLSLSPLEREVKESQKFSELSEDKYNNSNIQIIDLDEFCLQENLNTQLGSNFNNFAKENYAQQSTIQVSTHVPFLDTKTMSTSPSANYYRPTEEPEPLDLTQLNIEASVMCLISKIKFLCGRNGSPAIRLRHSRSFTKRIGFITQPTPDDVKNQTARQDNGESLTTTEDNNQQQQSQIKLSSIKNDKSKKGNKFTDGLDLSVTTDWEAQLRPSMRKLRHAMDGLLKTARLVHSIQRLQQNIDLFSISLDIAYRRDVCFSQALTTLISALMAKLWGTQITDNFIHILCSVGPLAYFEGLLSLHGNEKDMWGDTCVAIEDLVGVNFTLVRNIFPGIDPQYVAVPRLTGSRQNLTVFLPVPEYVYERLPGKSAINFKITPVFFNIGINEKATIAEALGQTKDQCRSNWDNYVRLKQYYARFRKLPVSTPETITKHTAHLPNPQCLPNILNHLEKQLKANISKNVNILHLTEDACRLMSGLRFTSCKSAKDRTGMAVSLEQCRVLVQEFQLPNKSISRVLHTMRSEGTRMDNVYKNIERRKYAFNLPQVLALPDMYRPPVGAYGKADT